ncbi:ATP-binding cassette domain-containing protein [Ruminococcaceae bacterium OttesenSCG-928-A16]|nr:ATP-binding cassette domain-containing protein [Ruminococcaceae bacterium OttesenSCG-928-A16]
MENTIQQPLIQVQGLKEYFKIPGKGMLHAVDDVSFDVYEGETLGLVGESGCGKSTVGNVIMRLLQQTEGKLFLQGEDVFSADKEQQKEFCKKMQIIFQDPYSSLNPRKTIRSILSEAYIVQKICPKNEIEKRIQKLCETVGIAKELLDYYPHELDGGTRQVVGIARSLSLNPKFIVCDEPVSSLDVSVQAKIINLLMDLQKKFDLTFLFISHDLSVVRHISNRIAVMYLGQIVEIAETDMIFENCHHPYTIALLSAIPKVDVNDKTERIILEGDVPSPINPKPGCRFAQRCWMAREDCKTQDPTLQEIAPGHKVACHYAAVSRKEAKTAKTTILSSL